MGLRAWISGRVRGQERDVVVLTVVPNEAIAGMICSVLASEGIEAAQKSASGGLPYGGVGGDRLILVPASEARRAKRVIEGGDPA